MARSDSANTRPTGRARGRRRDTRRQHLRIVVADQQLEARQRGRVGPPRVAERLTRGDPGGPPAIGEQRGQRVERVGPREVGMRDAAGPAQLGRGVLGAPTLELDVGQPGDKHAIVPVIERMERAGDRELAAASRIALDRIIAQPVKRGSELGHQRLEPVLLDQARRGGDHKSGRRRQRGAKLTERRRVAEVESRRSATRCCKVRGIEVSPGCRRRVATSSPSTRSIVAADSSGVHTGAFFRERYHLEILARTVLPELARAHDRRELALWSAGCASGHAAWSLAMIVREARLPAKLAVRILATDEDPRALACAGEAVYPELHLADVSSDRRQRHFVRGVGSRQGLWRIIAPLRDRVELAALDLMSLPSPAGFDVVLCHEPLAALDPAGAAQLVRRLAQSLAPGGVMCVGGSAAALDDIPGLEPYGRSIYRKPARSRPRS